MNGITDVDPTTPEGLLLLGIASAAAGALLFWVLSAAVRGLVRALWRGLVNLLRRVIGVDESASEAPPLVISTMPDTSRFVGRNDQVRELAKLVRDGSSRIVGLIGPAGLGKTLLAARLVEVGIARSRWPPFRRPFDGWFRLDCRRDPPLPFDLAISQLIRFIDRRMTDAQFAALTSRERIDFFVQALASRRLLIVLDNVEDLCVPAGDVAAGTFVDVQYEELIRALDRDAHGSVVILTSRERPHGLADAGAAAYHQPELTGLRGADARRLLRDNGVKGTNQQLNEIAQRVDGTPLWLVHAAAIARDERGDAAYLLGQPHLLTREGEQLIANQVARVSSSDAGRLLSAMAVFRLPVPLQSLQFSLGADGVPGDERGTRQALAALRERSLVESPGADRSDPYFTLHPQLQRYLLDDGTDRTDAHSQAATAWLRFNVPSGAEARTVEDVLPWIEAHHHFLESGRWQDAVGLSMQRRFGLTESEAITEFLTRRGFASLRLELDSDSASRADGNEDPVTWATVQNNLGLAYANLPTGDRVQNLGLAIDFYQAALRIFTENDNPANWAGTQNNLGLAYASLPTGDRAQNLVLAIDSYRAALRVSTENDSPADWAGTQNNLGNAYASLATGGRAQNLGLAIDFYQAALRIFTENDNPADWAMAQNNLGLAYANLPTGDRAQNLGLAIDACQAALRIFTENDYPASWATAQNNLGLAYANLPTGDLAQNLGLAIDSFQAALRVWTEDDYPANWATTQNNLGNAYAQLPTGDRGENLRSAIAAFEAALRVHTEVDYPAYWAITRSNLKAAQEELTTSDGGRSSP